MEWQQIYEKPNIYEDCQAKWIREFKKTKANGKIIFKIGGLTTASYLNIGEFPKSLFGAPEKRICQFFTVNISKNEQYTIRRWSVLREKRSKKYLIDNYFASRVVKFYAFLKGVNYQALRGALGGRILGHTVITYLIEIKKEIGKRNSKAFDKFGVPKASINYLNRLIDYLREEFYLKQEIALVENTNRQILDKKAEIQYLKELEEESKEKIDEYTDQEDW